MSMPGSVGEYALESPLGSGTAGAAYRGRNLTTGAPVAVKLLHSASASDPEIQRRFVREVSILEKLTHPNIVRHLDCGITEDGQLYLVMELVDSGTLKQVLARRERLPWREAAECAAQVAEALDHAHNMGVVHRDLKPANLFLASDGWVKVGDFGLARDANLHRLTMQGNTVGTCRYIAPEQARAEDDLDGRADLYALGCIVFEMLTGRTPFDGNSVVTIIEHHLYSPIPRLANEPIECPANLAALVETLLAKRPADRPATAAMVADRLRHIVAGATDDAPAPEGEPVANEPLPNLVQRMLGPDAAPRAPNLRLLAVVVAAAVLAGLGWWLLR